MGNYPFSPRLIVPSKYTPESHFFFSHRLDRWALSNQKESTVGNRYPTYGDHRKSSELSRITKLKVKKTKNSGVFHRNKNQKHR